MQQVKGGSGNPLDALGYSGEPAQHPVLAAVLKELQSSKRGSDVRSTFGGNGWAFGPERDQPIPNDDAVDAADLYRVLGEEVIPLYYLRDSDNVPRGWVALMKEAIRSTATAFSARRMVKEYVDTLYLPALHGAERET